MNKIKVLIEGYAREIETGWIASSTVTLVNSNGKKIIVDPGCSRPRLLKALAENGLETSDIDFVLLTHNHADHILLAGIFENAKIVVGSELYDNDNQIEHEDKMEDLDLQIIHTPGHSPDSRSFIVKTADGIYAIAADLFWWMDSEEQRIDRESLLGHQDPYAKNMKLLEESRKKILDLANYIIPGHGKMFKDKK